MEYKAYLDLKKKCHELILQIKKEIEQLGVKCIDSQSKNSESAYLSVLYNREPYKIRVSSHFHGNPDLDIDLENKMILKSYSERKVGGIGYKKYESFNDIMAEVYARTGVNDAYWHYSGELFDSFDNKNIKNIGFYLESREDALKRYKNDGDENGYLYECRLKKRDVLEIDGHGINECSCETLKKVCNPSKGVCGYLFTDWEWEKVKNYNEKKFIGSIQAHGYNGLEYKNALGGGTGNVKDKKSVVIFDASDIVIVGRSAVKERKRAPAIKEKERNAKKSAVRA